MKTLGPIDNELVFIEADGRVHFHAKAAVDVDGSGSPHGDPCYQPDTSLHLHGQPLNADVDRYIVVPPAIIAGVAPVVLGCQARVTNEKTGKSSEAVVGDIGPRRKLGEVSYALAVALGIPPSPVSGGEEDHVIFYELWPGKAAVVEGKPYALQPSA